MFFYLPVLFDNNKTNMARKPAKILKKTLAISSIMLTLTIITYGNYYYHFREAYLIFGHPFTDFWSMYRHTINE